ncbi:septum formation family protein [Corynebacterium felinum]|uniref:Septum formation-related domain-containing protein n=1 Tax=Corynebacterium felinum TaxID=131318 RepID=A0ABU2B646_9CORY|nr:MULTISPECIES: septum formation family protein [Corynebacterium]MDF5820814.1 septum formation family protein [Corynebacterium felinum]MDO4762233.1 septum formation family protein [Corynebacterium sp.]MDR7354070.1 hypothetical protein [Corynebacterium felinum]WJY96242.1 putative membrane protein [Corynebacterium felinum]
MNTFWRSAQATRVLLVAALASTSAVGGYSFVKSSQSPSKNVSASPVSSAAADASDALNRTVSFTSADAGSCVTWKVEGDKITDFEQTDCAAPHRFEVSFRENLATYPSSEFGPNAKMPNQTRQAQLREELCLAPTMQYMEGMFDQLGKYSVASILPPQESWDAGDRTLLCGIQATDENGVAVATSGKAKQQDQSRVVNAGQCVAVDATSATKVVDCAAPHQLEATAVVDLLQVFPNHTPSLEEQDQHLSKACTQAARDYLGGDDPLYYSTLKPFWTTIPANSWSGGSHSVNCSLIFVEGPGFATLEGSAKGTFTINGNPPETRPERAPIVNPEALEELNR